MDNSYTRIGINSEQSSLRPRGIVLAERYKLGDPVGRGGFSIVYDAEDLQTGRRVAVKECTIPSEKERFLREAKLLEDFSEEDAIVTVLDFFEIDGTVFIVMEFLDGRTLRENIESKGKWHMEDAVRRMSPMMKTLKRMHEKGVIHRDISPDNIMVMDDGSLKLLDFGAAKQYEDSTLSRMVVKASYSPPEQMDTKGILGSWSDVYSICAAIYFCITGNNPEDAISRLLMDDLKKPSELGADISPVAEKILMRGMSLESMDRIRDMEKLRIELEEVYPILTEEEKLVLSKKRKKKLILAVAATVVVLIGVLLFMNAHKLQVLFHTVDTETVLFTTEGVMTTDEFEQNVAVVKERVNVLSNGYYLWEQGEDWIRIEVPLSMYNDLDPQQFSELFIAAKLDLNLMLYNGDSDAYEKIGILTPSVDIVDVYSLDNTVMVEFADSAQERLKEHLSQKGLTLIIDFSANNDMSLCFRAVCIGDGKTAEVTNGDTGDTFGKAQSFAEYILTSDPLTDSFFVSAESDIEWEDSKTSSRPGKNQISDAALRKNSNGHKGMRWYYSVLGDRNEVSGYNVDTDSFRTIVKNRMGVLEIPYAIGSVKNDENMLVVEVQPEDMTLEMATMIGLRMEIGNFMIGSSKTARSIEGWFTIPVITEENGKYIISLKLSNYYITDEESKERVNYLKKIKSSGDDKLYLQFNSLPIASVEIDEAIDSVKNGTDLAFGDWCAADGKQEQLIRFTKMIMVGLEQSPRNNHEITRVQAIDEDGKPYAYQDWSDHTVRAIEKADEYIEEWKTDYKELSFVTLIGPYIRRELDVINYQDAESNVDYMKSAAKFCSFYKSNRNKLEDGTFDFLRYDNADISIIICTDDNGRYYMKLIYAAKDEGLARKIADYFQRDEIMSDLITDKTEVSDDNQKLELEANPYVKSLIEEYKL